MTRPLPAHRIAAMLGRSPQWFARHRAELEARGFPAPLPVVGLYSPAAVQAWLDSAGGTVRQSGLAFEDGLKRLRRGSAGQRPAA